MQQIAAQTERRRRAVGVGKRTATERSAVFIRAWKTQKKEKVRKRMNHILMQKNTRLKNSGPANRYGEMIVGATKTELKISPAERPAQMAE
jgi:hypothetical protein